ncbi:class II aldolase and adducin N-terminal domain-containing protein [Sulfurospirillum arcachonense]|uniref:class II aldolase and adducin N-terminal domain-containing protein n=1 Tax=Sulfurospirillum arcachonense TaxID=57666 RepID=UPI00046819CA|nr:class II aldolase and adducin N-terminal domain-containing protein [Sulfurospirillum arcachonense]
MQKYLLKDLKHISLSMFRKDFIGIFHGSLSARIEQTKFFINKKDTIFDDIKDEDFIELYSKKDYRWNEASLDADIHLNIYKNINEAKYICYAMPPFIMAYSLMHDTITPKDYFGSMHFDSIPVYDPKQFEDWYERADIEIYRYLREKNTNIIVIKGYGLYAYDRDMLQLAKTIALLENSCQLLYYSHEFNRGR